MAEFRRHVCPITKEPCLAGCFDNCNGEFAADTIIKYYPETLTKEDELQNMAGSEARDYVQIFNNWEKFRDVILTEIRHRMNNGL